MSSITTIVSMVILLTISYQAIAASVADVLNVKADDSANVGSLASRIKLLEIKYTMQEFTDLIQQEKIDTLEEIVDRHNLVLKEFVKNTEGITFEAHQDATKQAFRQKMEEFLQSQQPRIKSLESEIASGNNVEGTMEHSEAKIQEETIVHTDPAPNVCLTPQCAVTAARVFEGMDMTVDPCDNFYDFACGGWPTKHELPDDRSNLYAYGLLREEVRSKLRRVLEKDVKETDIEAVNNAKHLYRSCINSTLIEEKGAEVAYPVLKEVGGWPLLGDKEGGQWNESTFDLTNLLISLLRYNNIPIISPWVGLDDKNNTRRIIFIDQPWFGMPDRSYYLDPSLEDKKAAYRELVTKVATLLGADTQTLVAEVDELIDFETAIANITVRSEDRRDGEALYNLMTVKELSERFPTPPEDANIKFDWLRYLQAMMSGTDIEIDETEEVVMVSPPFYSKIFDVLQKYSKRTIANYAVWRFMRNRASNLPKAFRDARSKYNKALYGTIREAQRWKTCTDFTSNNFGMVTGRLFVEETFNENAKEEVKAMIVNIRAAFNVILEKLDWMDDDMKAIAKEKADAIVEAVAYPEYLFEDDTLNEMYENMTMDPNNYLQNVLDLISKASLDNRNMLRKPNNSTATKWTTPPTTVNAFYSFQRNQITFPAGILQPPYFHIGQPRSMNYGGIGFLMGHEVTHGFDDRGRQYDKDGLLKNWWTDEAEEKFKEKSQCMIDQYSDYVSPEAGVNVNGITTQGENIADNGGLKQAYMAYRQWVKDRGSEEPTLPGLSFTNNQLFFISVAQIRCGVSTKEDALNHILTGQHSPNRFRIIGTLQNMREFSETFKCSNTSYMNPAKKCSIW